MASFVFNQVKKFAVNGTLNFNDVADGTYRVALMVSDIVEDPAQYSKKTKWGDISIFEITKHQDNYNNDGYTTNDTLPGSELKGVHIKTDTDINDDQLFDSVVYAENVHYNVSTIDADCAVIMRHINSDLELIAAIDLRVDDKKISSNNGTFSLLFDYDSGGFLTVK